MSELPEAVLLIAERVSRDQGVIGVFFVGSGARGDMDRNSDWDLVAVIDNNIAWPKPFRDGGRETFRAADGRQAEVMYSSAGRLRERMVEQAGMGIIATAEFLAEGRLLFETARVSVLQGEARSLSKSRPEPIPDDDLRWRCYEIWNQVKDLEDRINDAVSAYYLSFLPFWNLVVLFFRVGRCWLPRPKAVFPVLRDTDSDLYALCERFATARSPRSRLPTLRAMMRHLARRFALDFEANYVSPPVEAST
jgi:Nucleotidyltransferase domain